MIAQFNSTIKTISREFWNSCVFSAQNDYPSDYNKMRVENNYHKSKYKNMRFTR